MNSMKTLCTGHPVRTASGVSVSVLLTLVSAVLASSGLTACGGDSGSGSPPITISVSADPGTIQPGSSAQITATVSNDPSNAGVTWSVTCSAAACGTVSASRTDSGVATTYATPAGPDTPPTDLTVTLTAASVSHTTVTASRRVTVQGSVAIASFDVPAEPVLAGTTAQLAVTLINDPANRGVGWSVSCATPPCGTIAPSTSAGGVHVTYTAPAAVPPADLAVTVTASAGTAPVAQASATLTVPALAIVVGPSGNTVTAGTNTQFTATVNYPPPAGQGITWTVQCGANDCGMISPATSTSGAAVTYTAPATPPPADLTVTLIASSASATTVKGSVTLTVAAVSVGVTPISALLPLGISQQFVGNVGYDPTSSGVAWTLTQGGAACSSACGSVSPAATANGAASVYTAPGTLPPNSTVILKATSVADQTKFATAQVQLTNGSVQLVPADLNFIKIIKDHTPPPQTVTLTNTGTAALTIKGITIGGTKPKSFSQSNNCASSVAPASSCVITVSWRVICQPQSDCGPGTAVLSISDSSTDSPQQVHLSATTSPHVTAAMRTALAARTAVASPSPAGGGQVGTRVLYLVDSTRTDPYLSDGTRRELPVRFWYPAAADSACVAASYTPPQVWNYFSTLVGVSLPQVSTHSCLNAPIAAGPHPVVLLEHGFTGTFTDYTFLVEDLASRGYVVAAVNHTHEATAVEFPDGRLEKSVFGSHLTTYARSDAGALGFAVAVRLDDLRFVLNELERMNAAPGGHFSGRLDLTRVALVGHSLGGLTTLRALESEARLKAGVLLDGLMPPHFAKSIEQPVLSLVVGRERWSEDDCRLWDALHGPRVLVNLPGAEHIALSDAVWLLKGIVRTGDASPDQAIATIREHVATFLDSTFRGKSPESLSTSASGLDYPSAVVSKQGQSLCGLDGPLALRGTKTDR